MDKPYNLILEAYCPKMKNEVVFEIKNAISESDAWISDFITFSNNLIHFDIEIEFSNYAKLYEALKVKEIKFFNYSHEQFKLLEKRKIKGDLLISLNVNFEKTGTGDLGSRIDEI